MSASLQKRLAALEAAHRPSVPVDWSWVPPADLERMNDIGLRLEPYRHLPIDAQLETLPADDLDLMADIYSRMRRRGIA